jgi:serine/threonine-protein kinase
MAIQIGDIFGDYQVIGLLGRGGMGKVFRVRSLLTDREEAMKIVLPDLDENQELADRFLREIKVHASLEHPNICGLRAAMRVKDRIVMIMELVHGESLDDILREGPMELPTAIYYVDQVLAALDYAHVHGVIHRDIKPANILVTGPESGQAGIVKLTDFGIARSSNTGGLTGAGVALGSLWYMSPEQIRSEPVDARSDIYSLGITFYEMVTGRRPIQADSEFALMNAQLVQVPTPPAEVMPGLPLPFSDLIMRSLAKDPRQRIASAHEFRGGLRQSLSRSSSVSKPTPPATPPTPAAALAPPAFTTATTATASKTWDPAFLDKLTQLLAPHIGPIAKVVVNRAAKAARNESDLCQTLAAEIPSEADRKRFLGMCR